MNIKDIDWKEVGAYVAKAAPMLGTVIGGPAGGAVGGAVSLLASAFGITDPEQAKSPAAVLEAVKADPQAVLKLQELENTHRLELGKLALQSDSDYLYDRQDARRRQIESEKITGKKDINLYVLAWVVVAGFFILCGLLMAVTLPNSTSPVVFTLFGSLGTGFGTVLAYFFGSSKSSAEKTEMIYNSTPASK